MRAFMLIYDEIRRLKRLESNINYLNEMILRQTKTEIEEILKCKNSI